MVVSLRHRAVAESVPDIYDSYTGSITPRQQKIIGISMDSELEAQFARSFLYYTIGGSIGGRSLFTEACEGQGRICRS